MRICFVLSLTLILIGVDARKLVKKPVVSIEGSTEGPSPPPGDKLDPYRCDHWVDFAQTQFHLIQKASDEFLECCSSFPRGTFVCPATAPPGHVCGIVNPPNCCNCPPTPPPTTTTTTTTSTTTKAPKDSEEEEEDDEDEDEEDEEEK